MSIIALVGLAIIGFAIYFLPTFIAYGRSHPNEMAISILNLFLGWTVIGWVGSLAWAFTNNSTRAQYVDIKTVDESTANRCPFCAELVRIEAIKCKHCGSMLIDGVGTSEAAPIVTDDQAMQRYGITQKDGKYLFQSYRYEKLSDAINYAKRQ